MLDGDRILRLGASGPQWEDVHRVAQGRGRLALAPGAAPGREVLYSTSDDGVVFRHQRGSGGAWTTETIHRGAPGPRGIAAGTVELKRRSSGERQELSVESALARLTE